MKLKEKNKLDEISFWIDSSGGPKELCKNSFYGTGPKYYFYGSLNKINFADRDAPLGRLYDINCFDFIEQKLEEEKHNPNGIFVGYFAYDLFQNSKQQSAISSQPGNKYPDFFFAYFDSAVRHCEERSDEAISPTCHDSEIATLALSEPPRNDMLNLNSNMTDIEYLDKVKLIKEEIKKGNVYQVNLTREYLISVSNLNEIDLYLRLRTVSPNPYGCYFKTPFISILSSSPEEFLFMKDNHIRTRPIKGTLPKGEINIDPKNQAENIMIVDLERNDLGRICEYGSVKAEKLLNVESYKHLNHVVSTIEGELKKNISLREIFEAIFPGGSITGAPKIAAMKIIDEIEPTKRGAYTGSFGYIKTDGTMNFNILIRTIFIQEVQESKIENQKSKIVFNIGGGIVADSDPHDELEEVKLKARGIMSTLCLSF